MAFPSQSDIVEPLLILVTYAPGPDDPQRPGLPVNEVYEPLADYFSLTSDERKLPRSDASKGLHWPNQVQRARQKLRARNLLEPPEQGGEHRWRPTVAGVEEARRFVHRYAAVPRASHLALNRLAMLDSFGEEPLRGPVFPEGAAHQVWVNSHERNAAARAACIRHHGVSCSACGFNFAQVYGQWGKGFIHVHHLLPLKDIKAAYQVDPVADLRPVCANCHAVIHRRDPPLSLEELRSALRSERLLDGR